MPRASWNGFLRLSLVSCPIYLSPATSESSRISLHQLNGETGNRVRQQLVDEETGEKVERADIVRGYEYERHQYVVIPNDEIDALKIESSQTVDLDRFVKREEIDPLYLDTPYYVYPDGKIAIETFQVIGEAMSHQGRVGIGRIVLSSRERMVMVEPRGGGMLLRVLRSAEEVRRADFGDADGKADPDMVAVAETIIERRAAAFDPSEFRDRYQDALRELVESKAGGRPIVRREAEAPPKVISLMDALKRSLAQTQTKSGAAAKPAAAEAKSGTRSRQSGDRRQAHMLLPVEGGRAKDAAAAETDAEVEAKPAPERGEDGAQAGFAAPEEGVVSAPPPLSVYRRKRDFTKTAEPSGDSAVAPSNRLRYVIQKHAARRLHYDLRLELDGVFKSWAVTRGPSLDPHDKRLAVEVEDHPLAYGDFEGTIPEGQYGGGTVQLWDRGYWEPEGSAEAQRALDAGELKFRLEGDRLHGGWVLVRLKHDRTRGKRTNWLLIKHRDEAAQEGHGDAILEEDRSVASGRPMQAIKAGTGRGAKPFMLHGAKTIAPDAQWNTADMPDFVEPQLCRGVGRPPSGTGWAHEIKFDGYRLQLRVSGGEAQLKTRKGLDWTDKFREVAAAAASLPDALIDGEIVALDDNGVPDFSSLQAALAERDTANLVYFAFDLLFADGADLRAKPLAQRKLRLEKLLRDTGPRLRYVEHFEAEGDAILESARQASLEGIVSKRLDAPYQSGRSDAWTKAKCRNGHEVVIGGWSSDGERLRSLLAGVLRDGKLVYIGRVGTGFGQAVVDRLMPKLKAAAATESPFSGSNAPKREKGVHWLKPELVAEIEFGGWTEAGLVRQSAFKGLREDKPVDEVEADLPATTDTPVVRPAPVRSSWSGRAAVLGVPITHADKPLWPDGGDSRPVTKFDLAEYFAAAAQWIMPHIAGRPCSIVRAPDGIDGEHFFQRHGGPGLSHLLSVVAVSGDRKPYVQIDRPDGLIAVAQLGGVELHPWNCAPGRPDVPGRLVFDLDPAPDVEFAAVIAAAKELRDRVDALGLVGFCKTTGGKGLHVVVPLAVPARGGPDWPVAKAFARAVCERMADDSPDRYLINMAKKQRDGRIFLDYLRNDRLSTAVAVLSPRARPHATVSMPLPWTKIRNRLDPQAFTVRTAPALCAKAAAWPDYDAAARPLAPAIEKLEKAG